MSDFSIPSSTSSDKLEPTNSLEVKSTPSVKQSKIADTLYQAPSIDSLSNTKTLNAISLPPPEEQPISLWDLLGVIGGAQFDFRKTMRDARLLKYSSEASIPPPSYSSLNSASNDVANTTRVIDETYEQIEVKTDLIMDKLVETYEDVKTIITKQNDAINELMKGNAEQQQQFKAIIDAHQKYIDGLEALGATDNGNGVYTIPDTPEAQAEFLRLTTEYQTAVDSFNQYWSERVQEINQYNSQTNSYNAQVATINAQLNEALGPYIDDVPQLTPCPTIDISTGTVGSPQVKENNQVQVPALPNYVTEMAKNGPAQIDSLSIPTYNKELIEQNIYAGLEEELIAPLNAQLDDEVQDYYFQLYIVRSWNSNLDQLEQDDINELLSDIKYMSSENILPETTQSRKKKEKLTKILAADTLRLLLENQSQQIPSASLSNLALLSGIQLTQGSSQALIGIMQKMGRALTELPTDSSTLSSILSLRFVNNFFSQIKNGSLEEQITQQMSGISELDNLSSASRKSLISILKTNQLLMASKFLASQLGLTGFSDTLLSQMNSTQANSILSQVQQLNQAALSDLLNSNKSTYMSQGLSADKAQFLAEMAVNSVSNGWSISPSVATVSSGTVNVPLVINSVLAGLIRSSDQNLSLNECASIAETAVQTVLNENTSLSNTGFRNAVKAELDDMGMYKYSAEASTGAILIPFSLSINNSSSAHFQSILGPKFMREEASEFRESVTQLLADLSSYTLNELRSLPENIQNDLIINSMQTSPSSDSFLNTLAQPAQVLSSILSTIPNLKINKDIHI